MLFLLPIFRRTVLYSVFNFTVAALHYGAFHRVHRLLCNLALRAMHTYSTEISVVFSVLYMFPSLGLFCWPLSFFQHSVPFSVSLSPLISQETSRQPGRVFGEAQSRWSLSIPSFFRGDGTTWCRHPGLCSTAK